MLQATCISTLDIRRMGLVCKMRQQHDGYYQIEPQAARSEHCVLRGKKASHVNRGQKARWICRMLLCCVGANGSLRSNKE